MLRLLITFAILINTATAGADSRVKPVVVTDSAIELRDPIYFEVGKPVIKPESYATIDLVAGVLKADPRISFVEVQSHTDQRGVETYNLKISQQRAEAVVAALVARGIDAKRLRAKGYGESQPLDTAHTPQAWAKNRRMAFVIRQRIT